MSISVFRHRTGLLLAYHRILPDELQPSRGVLAVSVSEFSRQMSFLKERGWTSKTVSGIVSDHVTEEEPARKVFAVTFDDGYADNIMHAYPILRQHGFTATVYVTAGYPGTDKPLMFSGDVPDNPTLAEDRCLNADELRRLVTEGWEIGSHTMTHPKLGEADHRQAMEELQASRDTLSRLLDVDVNSFCYPFGSLTDATVACVEKAGYASAVVTPPRGGIPESRWTMHRVGVYGGEDLLRFRLKISPFYSWLRGRSLWWGVRGFVRS